MPVRTIEWVDGTIRIIDQTRLPERLVFLDIGDIETLSEAIRSLRVRGAPAIGIAGAMGAALAAVSYEGEDRQGLISAVREAVSYLRKTRPTAVNLFWALDRMEARLDALASQEAGRIREALRDEALTILEEDRKVCRDMGRNGAELLPDRATVLTHCNAGGLATSGYGTALGVIYAAKEAGKDIRVFADETRPLLQGSRLTAWELMASGVEVTVICDSAAGHILRRGGIDAVLVGADRIASNGDAANKIGTYSLAVVAERHGIPFYVVAPVSTIDFSTVSGDEIPIEERAGEEVVGGFGMRTGPEGVRVANPAFDVTPSRLITAIVTEKGVHEAPYGKSLGNLK